MPAEFLLDTNIISDLVRRPQGDVAKKLAVHGERDICTSIVVASELRFGAMKSGSRGLTDQLDLVLSAIEVLPLEEPADQEYAHIRNYLESRGTPIGPNELLIAAHALAVDCTLVTANRREFARVPGLKAVNWLDA